MPCTRSMRNPTWESCCKQGSVQLQLLSDPPEYLKNLLASTDTQGRRFKATFANTTLPLSLPLWDMTLSQLRSVMPTISEMSLTHSKSMVLFATARGHLFLMRTANHPTPNSTYMIPLSLHKEDLKETKISISKSSRNYLLCFLIVIIFHAYIAMHMRF